jgi:hypothetical protein
MFSRYTENFLHICTCGRKKFFSSFNENKFPRHTQKISVFKETVKNHTMGPLNLYDSTAVYTVETADKK